MGLEDSEVAGFAGTMPWPFVRRIALMTCASSTESTARIGTRERIRMPKSLLFISLIAPRACPKEGCHVAANHMSGQFTASASNSIAPLGCRQLRAHQSGG